MVINLCLPSPAPKTSTYYALLSHPCVASPAPPPNHVQKGKVKVQQKRQKKAKKIIKKVKVVKKRKLEELKIVGPL
ncbi:hypothetical protein FQN50_007695 [Emmonsiellopsis sp. PD_5]|nr:hypothetical protein FQN50_007695 [Emmonsiellopsis sp. PD_5]